MSLGAQEIREKTIPIGKYMEKLKPPSKEKFFARKQAYRLNEEAIKQLKKSGGNYLIIAFSAEWCKDCTTHIPVLALIAETTGLEIRIFGDLKKDPLNHTRKWRIPPSPIEVETFNIDKIPTIIIIDDKSQEVGRIVENPEKKPTLEQEICEIIRSRR